MRTAEQVVKDYGCKNTNDSIDKDDVIEAIKEYAKEVIDEILSRPQMIYVDESGEAVYSYGAFESFKKEMIK